ncbi:ParB N-terminal domain-containing protein (plasmid) [Methylobacterium sp. NMS12]|uniref:ParB N-terminal domain-containing protein n=1 Tax=Methylobacterium sp. NMS12 TaxID=3079766 RepID=UPI003F8808CF
MSYARKVEGLSNLFEGLDDVTGAVAATGQPIEVALDAIEEDSNQPRTRFSEPELDELTASIVERGVRQAITITPRGEGDVTAFCTAPAGFVPRSVRASRRFRPSSGRRQTTTPTIR